MKTFSVSKKVVLIQDRNFKAWIFGEIDIWEAEYHLLGYSVVNLKFLYPLKYFESFEIRSMESILQICVADDFYVKNPILSDCSKLLTILLDGFLQYGKITCVQIIWKLLF